MLFSVNNFQMIKEYGIAPALVLSAGIVVAAIVGGYSFYTVSTRSNTLTVTGSASATTTADLGKLTVTVSRGAYEGAVASVQNQVGSDADLVSAFFKKNGIEDADIQTGTVSADRDYSDSKDSGAPIRYTVHEDINVQSHDPHLIERVSKDVAGLASRGIFVSVQQPQYYISNLPELRVALIGKAVTDAKDRATEIAKSVGQSVGRLQSASSGVVQVMAPNSTDVADYGSYDTSTIDKQVMVTAKATFVVR